MANSCISSLRRKFNVVQVSETKEDGFCNVAIDLPRDIVHDILSRLPVKTLLRVRSVCKAWCNMIDDPTFAIYHVNQLNNTLRPTVSILFIDRPCNNTDSVFLRSLEVVDDTFKTISLDEFSTGPLSYFDLGYIQGVCNGLLCYSFRVSKDVYDLYLCNPFKRDTLKLLPHGTPSQEPALYGFGVDSTTNTYKVVRVYRDITANVREPQKAEVHTLGTKTWRKLKENNNPPCRIFGARPIFANGGSLYWPPCCLGKQEEVKLGIVTFDLTNEVFSLTPRPNLGIACYHLFNLQGCLGLFDESSDKFGEIWLFESSWVQMYKLKITFVTSMYMKILGMWDDVGLLIQSSSCSLVSYNTKTDQWRRLVIYDMYSYTRNIFAFERSLILPSNLNK